MLLLIIIAAAVGGIIFFVRFGVAAEAMADRILTGYVPPKETFMVQGARRLLAQRGQKSPEPFDPNTLTGKARERYLDQAAAEGRNEEKRRLAAIREVDALLDDDERETTDEYGVTSRRPKRWVDGKRVWFDGDQGERAVFTYVDRDGVVTEREIIDWYCDGHYVHGHCRKARAERTFRTDRIEDWTDL